MTSRRHHLAGMWVWIVFLAVPCGCALDTKGTFTPGDTTVDDGRIDQMDIDVETDGTPDTDMEGDLTDADADDLPETEAECTSNDQCIDEEPCNGEELCGDDGLCADGDPLPDDTPCTTPDGQEGRCRTALCAPVLCGNATVNAGEECDDGNSVNGDGCETNCRTSCHSASECADTNVCTEDLCETVPTGRMCTHPFTTDPCDDGDDCTMDDVCDGAGTCAGTAYDCAPGLCESDSRCDGEGGCTPVYADPGTACDDGLHCTTASACDGGGRCLGSGNACDDGVLCTTDDCTEGTSGPECDSSIAAGWCLIGGVCVSDGVTSPTAPCMWCESTLDPTTWSDKPPGAPCDDTLFCTLTDTCDAAGACTGTGDTCDDGGTCTVDSCNEGTDRCTHTVQSGWCYIGGVCHADGTVNPVNACQSCNTALSTSAWQPAPSGTPCDDGLYCTLTDACDASGGCIGSGSPCTDTFPCTTDQCDEGTRSCSFPIQSGWCLIGSVCVASGTRHPSNQCLGCNPALDPSDWSFLSSGTTCDDGLYCTVTDTCNGAGACTGTGSRCSDGIACTNDVCDEGTHACSYPIADGWCRIGGVCYTDGTHDPTRQCWECNPALSTTAWSPSAGGTACDDTLFCTALDTCNGSGTCTGAGSPCGDGLACTTDSCNESTNSCSYPVQAGWCLIGGACIADGQLNPSNPCQECDASASQTTWRPSPPGGTCSDGLYCTTTDQCNGGGGCSGTGNPCDDARVCTDNVCTEGSTTFVCSYPVRAGYCLIDGYCYTDGQDNPADSCEECRSAITRTAWSYKDAGSSCTDGYGCTTDACDASGNCIGTPSDGACPTLGQLCRPACFPFVPSGCAFPPSYLSLACTTPVTIPATSSCTIDLGGTAGQTACLRCGSEAGTVVLSTSDFGDGEGACSQDGWTLQATNCCNDISCTPSSCNQGCCTAFSDICYASGGRYYLRTPRQQCSAEEWRLTRTFDLRGLADAKVCVDIADNNASGTNEAILVYAGDSTHAATQLICQLGEPRADVNGVFYTYCADLPSWTDGDSAVTITLVGHAEDNYQYLYLDNVRIVGWVSGCAANETRIYLETFTGCLNPITSGWNGWTVTGTPNCPGTWACPGPSTSPSAQAVDESWTLERSVDTTAVDGEVTLCFSLGDSNGGTSLSVDFDARGGAGWQTAWSQSGNLGPDSTCRKICVNLSRINPAVSRNPGLGLRFRLDSNVGGGTGYYVLDDIEVWGGVFCNGSSHLTLGPISETGGGFYSTTATDTTSTPLTADVTCSWDTPPAPIDDMSTIDFVR
jgi:hypothetical protein